MPKSSRFSPPDNSFISGDHYPCKLRPNSLILYEDSLQELCKIRAVLVLWPFTCVCYTLTNLSVIAYASLLRGRHSVPLVLAFIAMGRVTPNHSPFLIYLHSVLTDFSVRGQLTLELFAPLFTTLGSCQSTVTVLAGSC